MQASEAELRSFVSGSLQRFKVPARIVVTLRPLPRNDAGKVSKGGLRQLFS
jgi:acyl-CoA synthetase (AMP-forming)/AMP-acid ligase II